MVRPGEPAWTQTDTDMALALLDLEAEDREREAALHDCGQPRTESMHPDSEFAYDATPIRCHACAARDRKARALSGEGQGFDTAGISWLITRRR